MISLKRLLSASAFLLVVLAAPNAVAQCFWDGTGYQCAGNADGWSIIGTSDSETFIFADGTTGTVVLSSGGGSDTIDLSAFTSPVSINLTETGAQAVSAGGLVLVLSGFNGVEGHRIIGGSENDHLTGGPGNDELIGRGGADMLDGGLGVDRRGDTLTADCLADTLTSIEADLCPPPTPVPTLSDWAMILFGAVLAGGAALYIQRRRQLA